MGIGALLTLLLSWASILGAVSGDYEAETTDVYIVVMKDLPPTVAYNGSDPLFAATAVEAGQGLDKERPAVRAYQEHLRGCQLAVLRRSGIDPAKTVYSYRYAVNGFAVSLTEAEAALVGQDADVAYMEKQHTVSPMRDASSARFLKLRRTLWRDAQGKSNAGENVIIGVVDSGIWPEHPSFSDAEGYSNILDSRPLWQGSCSTTDDFPACNDKVVGAKYFFDGALAAGDAPNATADFLSARDSTGHGTHSASIAAGNNGVRVEYDGLKKLGAGNMLGRLTGIAPRARLAIYKVFWTSTLWLNEGGSGQNIAYTSDIVAAVDAATADGVDVINYSAGPNGNTNFFDPVAIAALYATQAGIFFAASGGNRGPSPSTLLNFQPWMMTVAATSDDRFYRNGVSFGSGSAYGTLNSPGLSSKQPFILAKKAPAADVEADFADFCFADTLNATLVKGKIVLCTNPVPDLPGFLAEIVEEVKGKGGKGVVIRNMSPDVLPQTYASVPSSFPAVQVSYETGVRLEDYYNTAGKKPMAKIWGADPTFFNEAPCVMDFSSRGPVDNPGRPRLVGNANDILKPDVAAPGFNVWGASSAATGQLFQVESGTSAATPHIAGIAAIVKQLRPDWSPYAIKSAILTSASFLDNHWKPIGYGSSYQMEPYSATPEQGPFDYGSGFVNTDDAPDPGLVYDSQFIDYVAFLYTTSRQRATATVGVPDPNIPMRGRDLNLPNIGIANLVGTETVTRTIKRVGKRGGRSKWRVSIEPPAGVEVTISPSELSLLVGESATFEVTFTVTATEPVSGFVFGSFTWHNRHYSVRSQLAVQPLAASV